jgi:hypothetical protein
LASSTVPSTTYEAQFARELDTVSRINTHSGRPNLANIPTVAPEIKNYELQEPNVTPRQRQREFGDQPEGCIPAGALAFNPARSCKR